MGSTGLRKQPFSGITQNPFLSLLALCCWESLLGFAPNSCLNLNRPCGPHPHRGQVARAEPVTVLTAGLEIRPLQRQPAERPNDSLPSDGGVYIDERDANVIGGGS